MLKRNNRLSLACAALAALGITVAAQGAAVTVFNENFDGYNTGNLYQQGNWGAMTTGLGTNPIQVTAAKTASLTTSGEDDYKAFSATGVTGNAQVAHDDGGSLVTSFTLTTSAAQSGGDYFLHLSTPAGGTNFYERIHAKSTTGGYLLGLVDVSGTGSTVNYGTTVLNFDTAYTVAVTWNFVAGATNDTFNVKVNNADYLNTTWTSASAEPTVLQALNLRQGSSTAAPTLQVDNITVTANNATVSSVPEPTSLGLVGLVGAGLVSRRRRRA